MFWHSFGTEPPATMPTSQVMSINSYTVCEHQFAISVTRRKYLICDSIFDGIKVGHAQFAADLATKRLC